MRDKRERRGERERSLRRDREKIAEGGEETFNDECQGKKQQAAIR